MGWFQRQRSDPPAVSSPVPSGDSAPPRALEELRSKLTALSLELETRSQREHELVRAVASLEERMDRLTIAVAEGIEHVDRSERRVRATVARARKELEENGMVSPGVEAEWGQLRESDDDGSERSGVQPMRASVEEDARTPVALGDSFPGAWTQGDLASLIGA